MIYTFQTTREQFDSCQKPESNVWMYVIITNKLIKYDDIVYYDKYLQVWCIMLVSYLPTKQMTSFLGQNSMHVVVCPIYTHCNSMFKIRMIIYIYIYIYTMHF